MEAYSPLKMQRTPGESSPGMRLKVTAHARSASLEVIMDRCILQDHIFTFIDSTRVSSGIIDPSCLSCLLSWFFSSWQPLRGSASLPLLRQFPGRDSTCGL